MVETALNVNVHLTSLMYTLPAIRIAALIFTLWREQFKKKIHN